MLVLFFLVTAADTSSRSPTSRLIGQRLLSISGCTRSITIDDDIAGSDFVIFLTSSVPPFGSVIPHSSTSGT